MSRGGIGRGSGVVAKVMRFAEEAGHPVYPDDSWRSNVAEVREEPEDGVSLYALRVFPRGYKGFRPICFEEQQIREKCKLLMGFKHYFWPLLSENRWGPGRLDVDYNSERMAFWPVAEVPSGGRVVRGEEVAYPILPGSAFQLIQRTVKEGPLAGQMVGDVYMEEGPYNAIWIPVRWLHGSKAAAHDMRRDQRKDETWIPSRRSATTALLIADVVRRTGGLPAEKGRESDEQKAMVADAICKAVPELPRGFALHFVSPVNKVLMVEDPAYLASWLNRGLETSEYRPEPFTPEQITEIRARWQETAQDGEDE